MIFSTALSSQKLSSQYFSLEFFQLEKQLSIKMNMKVNIYKTNLIPATFHILDRLLPGIYKHECFNYQKRSFAKEVTNTETGHLFEHILLEYIFRLNSQRGVKEICLKGQTNWNWVMDSRGTFHININSGFENLSVLQEAVCRGVELMDIIFGSLFYKVALEPSQQAN